MQWCKVWPSSGVDCEPMAWFLEVRVVRKSWSKSGRSVCRLNVI